MLAVPLEYIEAAVEKIDDPLVHIGKHIDVANAEHWSGTDKDDDQIWSENGISFLWPFFVFSVG